jgi:hypothetical protein
MTKHAHRGDGQLGSSLTQRASDAKNNLIHIFIWKVLGKRYGFANITFENEEAEMTLKEASCQKIEAQPFQVLLGNWTATGQHEAEPRKCSHYIGSDRKRSG